MPAPTQYVGPHDDKIGDLLPGQFGWLPLDPNGLPSGPATFAFPGISTAVARVFASFQPNLNIDALVTPAGGPLTDRMNANSDRLYIPPRPDDPIAPPTLASIAPATAVIGGADLTLICTGTNYTPTSKIMFNGGEEPTTFISPTSISTVVRPSTASTPGDYPVTVKTILGETPPKQFTFTLA
jgi:hypothetical protein